ncbi:hypothetical protein NX059_005984 [Plenodomus lindquistii]|nr:hypothetical protein NX059_005984 [Plenodomus lindquistii]
MAAAASKELLAKLKDFRTSGDFTDLTIVCGKDVYHVHKVVVCALSPVFLKAMKFPGKEAEENKIDLSQSDPAIVKLLVQFIYEAEYAPKLSTTPVAPGAIIDGDRTVVQNVPHRCTTGSCYADQDARRLQVCQHHICGKQCNYNCMSFRCDVCLWIDGDASQLLVHAKMYQMADIYDILGLKKLCINKFQRACLFHWDSLDFVRATKHVFESTPEHDQGLRNIVCNTISQHIGLLDKPGIELLMTECNALVFGVLLLEKARR